MLTTVTSSGPEGFLKRRLSVRLGITPRTLDFGTAGHLFFHTSCGEVAESEEMITFKLGFVRTPTMSPLSAQQLLSQKIAQPRTIDSNAIRGNALVACLSKTEPCFSTYETLMALPQLYYVCSDEHIVCATALRPLLALLDQLPRHMAYLLLPMTCTVG